MFGQNMMVGTVEDDSDKEYTWTIKEQNASVLVDSTNGVYSDNQGVVPFNLYGLPDTVSVTVDWGDGKTSILTPSSYSSETDFTASVHSYGFSVVVASADSVDSGTSDVSAYHTISMTASKDSWSHIYIID